MLVDSLVIIIAEHFNTLTAMEIDFDLEGFFRDASEELERSNESEVASAPSRHVKLIKKIKKCKSKKAKTLSKVKTRPRSSKSKNKMPKCFF